MEYEYLKGSEKDFECAPEWATECVWNDKGSESFCYWLNPKTKTIFNPNWHSKPDCWNEEYGWRNYIKAERRPITEPSINKSSWRETAQAGIESVESAMKMNAQWDGEGLPPVGALCQYRAFSDMPWVECEVLGWHGDDAWMKRTEDGRTFVMGNPELFPTRSPEDVARGNALYALEALHIDSDVTVKIYDAIAAGKIPGVKLEGK